MPRRWDVYVSYQDPISKVAVTVRCYGEGTAAAIAAEKRRMGFDKVKIFGRPVARRKEQKSVSYSRILGHEWSGGVY
jgi:hypothetical protein